MGLFELIYYLGFSVKKAHDLSRQKRLPVRVVCVGNLTIGGTGKTPATIALAREALRREFKPCVLTRGYRGKLKGPCVVTPQMREEDTGDEPLLMANRLGGIPVVKGGNRYEAGMFAIQGSFPPPDVFILDDGFQHRRLYREMDILLINSRDPFDNGRLLPMGRLREPLRQMKRADIIVLTKCGGGDNRELVELIRKYNPHSPVFEASHRPSYISSPDGKQMPVKALAGKKAYAFCGIGESEYFRETLEGLGAKVKKFNAFGDHYRFTAEDVAEMERAAGKFGADWMITTEKDMMRLKGAAKRLPLDLVSLGIEFEVGGEFYDRVFETGEK